MPLAVPLAAITVMLLRVMAIGQSRLATALLGPPGATAPRTEAASAAAADAAPRPGARAAAAHRGRVVRRLHLHADLGHDRRLLLARLGVARPGISVAFHAVAVSAVRAAGDPVASFLAKVELCVVIAAICFAVWALSGGGYLWPVWPVLGMAAALGLRALFLFRNRLPWVREQALVERVDQLTRTRRGALDVQDSELRRIERDLHDGAQARLVALSMQLGRAEARLEDHPELADLVRQARGEASAAIAELRDLARGIAPPVLVARGLEAAIDALGRRAMTAVTVDAHIDRRPPAVIETAAYFVVAEALTNVAKHAPQATAHVELALDAERLLIEVADDGPGGADAGRRRADRPAPPRRGARRHLRVTQPGRRARPRSGRSCRAGGDRRGPGAAARGARRAAARERRRRRGAGRRRPGPAARHRRPQARPRDRRRAPPAHVHRRGRPRGHPGARAPPGRRHPDPVPVHRAGLHGRAAGDRRGRDRLPAQGAGGRHPGLPRRAAPGGRRAAPRWTARSSPS